MTISSAGTNYVAEAEYNSDNTLKNLKDSNSRIDLSYNIRNQVTAAVSSNVVETTYGYSYNPVGNVTNFSLLTSPFSLENNYSFL